MLLITLDRILTEFAQTEKTFLNVISVLHFIFSLIYDYLNNNENKKSINEIELLLQNTACKEIIHLIDNSSSDSKLLKSFYNLLKRLNENENKQLKQFLKVYLYCTKHIITQQFKKLKLFQQEYDNNSELIKENDFLVSLKIVKNLMNNYILQFNLFDEYSILISLMTYFNTLNTTSSKIVNILKLFIAKDVSIYTRVNYYESRILKYKLLFKDMTKCLSTLNDSNEIDLQLFNDMFDFLQNKLNYMNKMTQRYLLSGIKESYKLLFEMKKDNKSFTELKTIATCNGINFSKTEENLIVKETTNGLMILLNNYLLLNEKIVQQFNIFGSNATLYNGEFEILDNDEVFTATSNEYRLKYVIHYTLFDEINKQLKVDLELCNNENEIVFKVSEEKSFTMKFNSENKCCKVWNLIIQQIELEWYKNYKQKKLFNTAPLYLNDISFSFN
ncbi:hypothetical protein ABK040_011755 [Willaertia magna]